jgi:hypothetical protein
MPFARTVAPLLLAGFLMVVSPRSAFAFLGDPGTGARHRFLYTNLTAGQYNPLGLQTDLLTGYRYRLFTSDSPILRDTFVGVRQILRLNPAFTRIGALVEVQPAAVVTLRLHYEHRDYFGTARMLQSYPDPYAEYDDATAARRADAGLNYSGHGHQLWLQLTLRAKVGPVALLNETEAHYFRMGLRDGDHAFYDAFFDALVPARGWVLANHAHLVVLVGRHLVVGVRYTVVHALYPEGELAPALGNPNTPNHKIGPVVAYVLPSRGRYFRSPTIIAVANWWLRSRYRTGARVSQAIPYAILAFQFSGELWSK